MTLYKVGTIVNTHGVKGEVRVIPITDFPEERFAVGAELVIQAEQSVTVTVASMRQHKQFILLTFAGLTDINAVEHYKGDDLLAEGEAKVALPADSYFYHDIIGLAVEDAVSGQLLGKVKEILNLPANDVWVVEDETGQEIYLPYIEQVVKTIDLTKGVALVTLPEEL